MDVTTSKALLLWKLTQAGSARIKDLKKMIKEEVFRHRLKKKTKK